MVEDLTLLLVDLAEEQTEQEDLVVVVTLDQQEHIALVEEEEVYLDQVQVVLMFLVVPVS